MILLAYFLKVIFGVFELLKVRFDRINVRVGGKWDCRVLLIEYIDNVWEVKGSK